MHPAYEILNGQICLGGQPIAPLIDSAATPSYIYNLANIRNRIQLYQNFFQSPKLKHQVHYAVKANHHPEILHSLKQLGCGFDVVSLGEIKACQRAGALATSIVFSGVGKSELEIKSAIDCGILQINIESEAEYFRIRDIASQLRSPVAVAFRLNPDIKADTHPGICTGHRDNKFGMLSGDILSLLQANQRDPYVKVVGLALHIGSQILDLEALELSVARACEFFLQIKRLGFPLHRLDIGGGLGIRYDSNDPKDEMTLAQEYNRRLTPYLENLSDQCGFPLQILTEPGRFIVARSGLLVTRVEYVKRSKSQEGKSFIIVDTGMHHLLRPALYGAQHRIFPLLPKQGPLTPFDVVGPICESSDVLAKNCLLPDLGSGDLLGIFDVGAYGACMANQYNLRQPPIELVIDPENAAGSRKELIA